MSIFDTLQDQVRGLDLEAIGRRIGLTPEQVRTGAAALLPHVANPETENAQATRQVAQETGIPQVALADLIPALVSHVRGLPGASSSGAFGQILAGIPEGDAASPGGIFGRLAL